MKNRAAEILFLVCCLFFIFENFADAQNLNRYKPTLKTVSQQKSYCQNFTNGSTLSQCLYKELQSSTNKLKKIESLSIAEIEKYPNFEGDYKKNARDLEFVGWFKEGLSDSQKKWTIYRNANCEALSKFQSKHIFKIKNLRCLISATDERIKNLYIGYLIMPDEEETLPVEKNLIKPHPCDETVTGNTLDIVDCESKKLKRSEANLRKLLKAIKNKINKTDFNLLEKAQKAWVEFRDTDDSANGLYQSGGGTARGPLALMLATSDTEYRIIELKKIYLNK
jgi:uncharacterized protein YecT (DUF1311 family)